MPNLSLSGDSVLIKLHTRGGGGSAFRGIHVWLHSPPPRKWGRISAFRCIRVWPRSPRVEPNLWLSGHSLGDYTPCKWGQSSAFRDIQVWLHSPLMVSTYAFLGIHVWLLSPLVGPNVGLSEHSCSASLPSSEPVQSLSRASPEALQSL